MILNDNNRSATKHGYSLLEVILATAILAASGLVLASMISAGSRLGARAQDRAEAMLIGQSLIDETLAMRQGEIFEEEDVVGEGDRWAYSLSAEADTDNGMIRLIAEVYRVSEAADRQLGADDEPAAARLVRWYLPRMPADSEGPGRPLVGGTAMSSLKTGLAKPYAGQAVFCTAARGIALATTLMELMIALGLLSILVTLVWGLMSTFSQAEQRAARIAERIQVLA